MRRDLPGLLILAAWLLLCALACGLLMWAVGPARAAPLPFARAGRAAPSIAGGWWLDYSPGAAHAWEVHLLPDGAYYARGWDGSAPAEQSEWSGTWHLDGGTVRVREGLLPPGAPGARDRDWSFPAARLRRTR